MIKHSEQISDTAIDKFYNELADSCESTDECIETDNIDYTEKLNRADEKLNILSEDISMPEIDIMALIEKGEQIKEKRKASYELLLFTFISSVIVFLYAGLSVIFNPKILIISQFVILLVIPWSVIPAALAKKKGGEI